jgi:hypothetical protein
VTEPIDQQHLFPAGKPVTPLRALTERQERIYRLICDSPDGLEAIELGALLHGQSGRHSAEEFCEWCGQDGARALKEKAIRLRVVRRASGVYEPRDHADWTGRVERGKSSAQLAVLPGETFEDMFQRPDAA